MRAWRMAAVAFVAVATLHGTTHIGWAKSNVPYANGKALDWDRFRKLDIVWIAEGHDFCRVEHSRICRFNTPIRRDDTDTELAYPSRRLAPMAILFWTRHPTPSFTDMPLGRSEGVAVPVRSVYGPMNEIIEPFRDVPVESLIYARDQVDDAGGRDFPNIHAREFYKKSYLISPERVALAHLASQLCINRQPRTQVPFGDVSRVGQRLGAFIDGSFGGSGTDLRRPGGYSRVSKREQDGGDANASNDKTELGPEGLLLGSLHRTPLYAEILLVSILGAVTGFGINEGLRQQGRRGWWFLTGGLASYVLAVLLAVLIG